MHDADVKIRPGRKLPRQVDSSNVEDLAFSRTSMGVMPPRLSWSRSSLYPSIQAQAISRISSKSPNSQLPRNDGVLPFRECIVPEPVGFELLRLAWLRGTGYNPRLESLNTCWPARPLERSQISHVRREIGRSAPFATTQGSEYRTTAWPRFLLRRELGFRRMRVEFN